MNRFFQTEDERLVQRDQGDPLLSAPEPPAEAELQSGDPRGSQHQNQHQELQV